MTRIHSDTLNTMKEDRRRLAELNDAQERIREEKRSIAERARQEKVALIGQLFDDFMKSMKSDFRRSAYIDGQYTDDFTKHVARRVYYREKWWWNINPNSERVNDIIKELVKAQEAYMDARRELNKVFLATCEANPKYMREQISLHSSLKKLDNLT